MVASMIGLGPHEMTGWLWVFSAGLVVVFAALTAVSIHVALRLTAVPWRPAVRERIYPNPVSLVRSDAMRRRRVDDRAHD